MRFKNLLGMRFGGRIMVGAVLSSVSKVLKSSSLKSALGQNQNSSIHLNELTMTGTTKVGTSDGPQRSNKPAIDAVTSASYYWRASKSGKPASLLQQAD